MNDWYPGKRDEVSTMIILVAVAATLFFMMIGFVASFDGDSPQAQPTAVPAHQIYIDTDGGCIGCIWNR